MPYSGPHGNVTNTAQTVYVRVQNQPDLGAAFQHGSHGSARGYILRDDEISSLDPTNGLCWGSSPAGGGANFTIPCTLDASLALALLQQAHIQIQPVLEPPIVFEASPAQASFNRYIADYVPSGQRATGRNSVAIPATLLTSPAYWSTSLFSLFKGSAESDPFAASSVALDPNPAPGQSLTAELGVTGEGGVAGYPYARNTTQMQSGIFLETLRDLYEHAPSTGGNLSPDFMRRDVAHEILHTFTLDDEDGGIMCRIGGTNLHNNLVGGTMTDAELGVLRGVTGPLPGLSFAPRAGPCPPPAGTP